MAKGRMPDGVKSWAYNAKAFRINPRAPIEPNERMTDAGVYEMAYRAKLLSAARKGDRKAIKKLEKEYRCRLIRPS